MELQHINVKMFLEGELRVDGPQLIELFHAWVRDQVFEELLVDVADYRHVVDGPGLIVIGHEADYSMDHTGGRWGLRYNRRAAIGGTNEVRLRQAFHAALNACRMLESHFQGARSLIFDRGTFEISINDRALAPNTPETFKACKPDIEAFLSNALGHTDYTLSHHGDPRSRFGVTVQVKTPIDFAEVLTTLAPAT